MRGHTSHTPLVCSEVAVQCSQEMKFQRINKDNRAFCSRVSSLQAKQIETALVDSDGYHLSSLAGCSGDSAGLRFQRSGRLLGNVLSAEACNANNLKLLCWTEVVDPAYMKQKGSALFDALAKIEAIL